MLQDPAAQCQSKMQRKYIVTMFKGIDEVVHRKTVQAKDIKQARIEFKALICRKFGLRHWNDKIKFGAWVGVKKIR